MLRRLDLTTAGESHGPGLTAVLSGVPAGLRLDPGALGRDLARRQHGYGRGRRMVIETDTAEITGGVRGGVTLGSPIAFWIANRDHANWVPMMDPWTVDPRRVEQRRVFAPRPGHADLAGGQKYLHDDLRNVLERASARETTARVAAGAVAKALLATLGVEIRSGVRFLGTIGAERPLPSWEQIGQVEEASPLRAIHRDLEADMVALVDRAQEAGETLGGAVTVIAHGVPVGLGSFVSWGAKLDGRLGQALLSIPAVKAVEIGAGLEAARGFGSDAHDAILPVAEPGRYPRATNRAGGLEGGVTNGEDLVLTAYKKPIATLRKGLPSVDLDTGEAQGSQYERSDVTALPAAGVIAEAMVALVLADAALEKFGGDSVQEMLAHADASRRLLGDWKRQDGR